MYEYINHNIKNYFAYFSNTLPTDKIDNYIFYTSKKIGNILCIAD